MATALDIINSAFRLITTLESSEIAEAQEAQDALDVLNQMLETWSLTGIIVPYITTQEFTWPANTVSRTIGPTGNFVTTRPLAIDTVTATIGGITYPIAVINNDDYQNIIQKNLGALTPSVLYYNPTMPNGEMFVYPLPSGNTPMKFSSWSQLANIPTIQTVLSFPPGFLRAIRSNLAIDLANEYGKSVKSETVKMATESLAALKRLNPRKFSMQLDPALMHVGQYWNNRRSGFNIYRGW